MIFFTMKFILIAGMQGVLLNTTAQCNRKHKYAKLTLVLVFELHPTPRSYYLQLRK